jgi:ParB-like chromosome segregation protein Spo0J
MVKLNVDAEQVKGIYLLNITDIIVNPEENGRRFDDDGKLDGLLADILSTRGNSTAVKIRADEKGRPVLVAGYRRYKVIKLINDGKMYQDPETGKDSRMQIKAELVDVDENGALAENVRENAQRKNLSPIDQAYGMSKMLAQQKPQKDIAVVYGVSDATVSTRLNLLELPVKIQKLIHKGPEAGGWSMQTALEVLAAPEEDRGKLIDDLLGSKKKPTKDDVRKKRRKKEAGGEGKSARRSLKEIHNDFEEMALPSGEESEKGELDYKRYFAVEMIKYLKGRFGVKKLMDTVLLEVANRVK